MKRFQSVFLLHAAVLLFLLAGCSSSSSSDDEPAVEADDGGGASADSDNLSFSTLCGTVRTERLVNPVMEAEFVNAEVVDTDTLIIAGADGFEAAGPRLIKLHGISSAGVNPFRLLNGISILQQRLAAGAYYVSAGDECSVVVDGTGQGRLGQIFSPDGQSMAELMLQEGAAVPEADICEGDILASCYATIGIVPRPPTDIELDSVSLNLPSQCGAVRDGSLVNPLTTAEELLVDFTGVDQAIVTRTRGIEAGNQQAVKLHGISIDGVPPFRLALGLGFLNSETAAGAYFFAASRTCEAVLPGGGLGVYGQFYSFSGLSLNEELIRMGAAVPAADACGGELLQTCYASIEIEAPDPGTDPPSDLIIDDFLWKPVSEGDGNLVVLVNPENVQVVVSGSVTETLTDFGPSNERGTTARGSRPGCGYGSGVRVEFFDAAGRRIFIANGDDSVTIPSGCERVEFRL